MNTAKMNSTLIAPVRRVWSVGGFIKNLTPLTAIYYIVCIDVITSLRSRFEALAGVKTYFWKGYTVALTDFALPMILLRSLTATRAGIDTRALPLHTTTTHTTKTHTQSK